MITINGRTGEFTENMTIGDLLRRENYIFPLLIVKINGVFVPREEYESALIPDKANVDVIHLISGG